MFDKFLQLNNYIEMSLYVIDEFNKRLATDNKAITYIAFCILRSDLNYKQKTISRNEHRYKSGLWALLEYMKLSKNNRKITGNILRSIQKIDLNNFGKIKNLTDQEKHILTLKFIDNFSKSKISIIYGISQKTLEEIINNAIKKIKRSFEI